MSKANHYQLRDLPSVSLILDAMHDDISQWGHDAVTEIARAQLEQVRASVKSGSPAPESPGAIIKAIRATLNQSAEPSLKPVFNLTGIVLHSNLGRASLPHAADWRARDCCEAQYRSG